MLRDEKFYFGIFRGKTVLIRVDIYIYIFGSSYYNLIYFIV